MITYLKKNISWILSLLTISFLMVGCDQDDYAGFATLTPTSPTFTITTQVASASLIEDNSEYTFTATLSTKQLVDVKLYVNQVSGDATLGDDYTVTESLVIPAGSLSATGKIKILADEIIENTEKVKIQIGDVRTANATGTFKTMEFTILNYTSGDLALKLDWALAAKATDNSGNEISPTAFADLRLLVSSTPDNNSANVIKEADGAGFESLVLGSTVANGTYYIVADFYDANKTIFRDLNLNLTLDQAGVINGQMRSYANALNNKNICPNNFYVLAKIVKTSTSYTITDVKTNNFLSQQITWAGTDVKDAFNAAGYASKVKTGVDCNGKTIMGLNAVWMLDVWGETITKEGTVYFTVDASGNVTIPSQYIFTTLYSGANYDYTVTGTGTLNLVTGTLNIQYTLDQDGFSPSQWMFDNGYMSTNYFVATLTK